MKKVTSAQQIRGADQEMDSLTAAALEWLKKCSHECTADDKEVGEKMYELVHGLELELYGYGTRDYKADRKRMEALVARRRDARSRRQIAASNKGTN